MIYIELEEKQINVFKDRSDSGILQMSKNSYGEICKALSSTALHWLFFISAGLRGLNIILGIDSQCVMIQKRQSDFFYHNKSCIQAQSFNPSLLSLFPAKTTLMTATKTEYKKLVLEKFCGKWYVRLSGTHNNNNS